LTGGALAISFDGSGVLSVVGAVVAVVADWLDDAAWFVGVAAGLAGAGLAAGRFAGGLEEADDTSLLRSSRALRATSQPDRSNKPIARVCTHRLFLVILLLFPRMPAIPENAANGNAVANSQGASQLAAGRRWFPVPKFCLNVALRQHLNHRTRRYHKKATASAIVHSAGTLDTISPEWQGRVSFGYGGSS
jgi:hypothetical protein